MSHMSRSRSTVILLLAALPLVAGAAGCGSDSAPGTGVVAASVAADTVEARLVPLPQVVEAGGLVQATVTATVSSRLMADVRTVHVAAGDRVRRGQPLVTLDDRDVTSARAQAEAGVAVATQGRAAAEAERAAAEAALTLAELTHDRLAGLHAKRAATTQELDQSRAALTAAQARVAAATARVAEAASAIAAADAARDGAGVALSHATLRAPFDGLVAHVPVDPGTQVAPGMLVARVESEGRRVDVSLDAARAADLAAGDAATVLTDDAGAEPRAGTIAEVARTSSAGLQTVTIKVALADASLAPGRFVRVRFAGPSRTVLAVPASAVITRGQLTGVFVLDAESRARLRLVAPGATIDGLTEIVSGIDPGEVVLAAPPAHLTDGTPVTRGGLR